MLRSNKAFMGLCRKSYVSFDVLTCSVHIGVKNCLFVQNSTDEMATLSCNT